MMVLASVYLYVSGSLPSTSDIKPVEIWLIFNLVYPCFIILANVLLQVNILEYFYSNFESFAPGFEENNKEQGFRFDGESVLTRNAD